MARLYATYTERLLHNSVPGTGECWTWTGSCNNMGRPRIAIRIKGRSQWITVARFIVQFVHGKPWGRNQARRKVGAHNCDNPACVNPAHVSPSTQKQNVRECVARGRHANGYTVTRGAYAGKTMEVRA